MNEEVSHVAQWLELSGRARNHKLAVTLDGAEGFRLTRAFWPYTPVGGTYTSFFDLRAAISDYVAAERLKGGVR